MTTHDGPGSVMPSINASFSSGKRKKRLVHIADSSDDSDQEENKTVETLDASPIEAGKTKSFIHTTDAFEDENDLNKDKTKRRLRLDSSSDESDEDMEISPSKGYNNHSISNKNLTDGEHFTSGLSVDQETPAFDSVARKKRLMQILESSDDSDSDDNVPVREILESHNASDEPQDHDKSKLATSLSEKVFESSDESDNEVLSTSTLKQKQSELEKVVADQSSSSSSSVAAHNRIQDDSDDESNKESSSSDSSSSDDDDAPPIRIFRNKNAAAMNSRGYDSGNDLMDNDSSGDERNNDVTPDVTIDHPRRKVKRCNLPSSLEIKSETQRLIRESRVNLPYHVPEAKRLSQFLKRPDVFQQKTSLSETTQSKENKSYSTHCDEKGDSGVEIPDLNGDDSNEQREEEAATAPDSAPDRRTQLLALSGVAVPSLTPNFSDHATPNPTPKFIDLDDEDEESGNKEISSFMERFLKHSRLGPTTSKKKVQFSIIKKEERADGTGTDLVPDVISVPFQDEIEEKNTIPNYKTLREKLAAKMKQRRSVERKKREELYKLDNEDVGGDNEEEDEEMEDWTDEESSSEEAEEEKIVDEPKNHIIDDDDEESLTATQVAAPEISLSNASSISKASQHTFKSESMFPHLAREDSLSLFDDTAKKSNQSKEEPLQDQSFDPLYTSAIPPNKPKNTSDLSLKLPRLNTDEDSYFCSDRSMYMSSNQSPARQDFESQFFDSDGFIKEPKADKSLISLLPPGGEDDNANDCNMSQLLELCSGKFQVSTISPHPSDVEASSDVNGAFIDESFGFQVEADTEKQESVGGFSDEENDAEEEDNGITIIRRKKAVTEKMAKDFLEDEAELSGDDMGSDEDEDIGENNYEEEVIEEQLPKEEVIHQQVNKVHLKQLLDEDQRDIDLLQEAFVTEAVDVRRNRKFRWKNIDENLTPDLFHSDDENETCADDVEDVVGSEESQWRMLRLKREEYFNSTTGDAHTEDVDCADPGEDSQLLRMGKTALKRSRIFSEINEDFKTNQGNKGQSLSRSSSLTAPKLPSRNSFLARNPEVLSKFANFKEATVLKGAVNSNRMVFKAVSPNKKNVKVKRQEVVKRNLVKRPRLDEDSNSIFNLFEM